MISLRNVEKAFSHGPAKTYVLRRIDFDIQPGEFVSIMGPSGAGKSTLLHILGMHDQSWTGEYFFDDVAVHKLDHEEARRLAQSQHRLRLSKLSPARRSNRLRESRAAAFLSRRQQERSAVNRLRHARSISDRRQEGSLSQSTLRRSAATGRHRARGGGQSANHSRRRADRKSSFEPGQRDHGHVQAAERRRHDHRSGHALRNQCRLRQPDRAT